MIKEAKGEVEREPDSRAREDYVAYHHRRHISIELVVEFVWQSLPGVMGAYFLY